MEDFFFFKNQSGKRLFGALSVPEVNIKENGFVFCYPVFGEKTKTYRVLVNFARLLCASGFSVLRFDYFGEGDSEGDVEDATIDSRVNDILNAADFIKKNLNLKKINLLGLRLGADLATIAASKMEDSINSLVLWYPTSDIKGYFYEFLKGHLSQQLLVHKKIIFNRDALIDRLKKGENINVDGWMITNSLWEQLGVFNPSEYLRKISASVFTIVATEKEKNAQINIILNEKNSREVKLIDPQISWNVWKYYNPKPAELFEETLSWIIGKEV